jgi:hypothetical protein
MFGVRLGPEDDLADGGCRRDDTGGRIHCALPPPYRAAAPIGTTIPSPGRTALPSRRCAVGRLPRLLAAWARLDVLILDDLGIAPLSPAAAADLLELIDDRHGRRSAIVTSQLPVSHWHEALGEPTIADAILDRLVVNAYRIELRGDSLRRRDLAAEGSGPAFGHTRGHERREEPRSDAPGRPLMGHANPRHLHPAAGSGEPRHARLLAAHREEVMIRG